MWSLNQDEAVSTLFNDISTVKVGITSLDQIRTWEQLAQISDPSIFIASVDCGKEMELCRSYHIITYPTFRYYVNGVENDYDDAKSLDALREFIDTTLLPRCNPINNKSACSERGIKYGEKWIAKSSASDGAALLQIEINRLDKMILDPESVAPDLLRWIRERRDILQTIEQSKLNSNYAKTSSSDEL